MELADLLATAFERIYDKINKEDIKTHVDEKGIEDFIDHCAWLAGASGAIGGFGGIITMLAGLPADTTYRIIQHFRVTLGIIYAKTGNLDLSFEQFMKIIGASLGINIAKGVGRVVLSNIAKKMLVKISAKSLGRAVPLVGAAVGGTINYSYIKNVAKSMNQLID